MFTIKRLDGEYNVHDIMVEDDHSFCVGDSGMVAHNCFLPYVGDTVPDLLLSKLELSILSVLGGGLGQFYDVS